MRPRCIPPATAGQREQLIRRPNPSRNSCSLPAERFVEMRSVAARRGYSMGKRDRDDVGRATRKAVTLLVYGTPVKAEAK